VGKYLQAYLRSGDEKGQGEQRLRDLGREVAQDVERIVREHPEFQTTRQVIECFRDVLEERSVASCKASCGPPPLPLLAAVGMWKATREHLLAAMDLFLLSDSHLKIGKDRELSLTEHPELTARDYDEITGEAQRKYLGDLSSAAEDLLGKWGEMMDSQASMILAVLPNVPIDSPYWHPEREAKDPLLQAFTQQAPITCAVAWRIVLELERSRASDEGSMTNELRRLSRDPTAHVLRCWEELIWVASRLWSCYGQLIQRQATAEGKLSRELAETNVKALFGLQRLLDSEIEPIAEIRRTLQV